MAEVKNELKQFAIVGAGALGCFYGAKLIKLADRVQFQSKFLSDSLNHKKEPVEIESIWGSFSIQPEVHASTTTMSPADVVIVATKAVNGIDYASLLSPLLKKDTHSPTIIICLQNGIGQEEAFEGMFPLTPIIGGLAFTCVYRASYKKICHIDYGLIKLAPLYIENLPITEKLGQLFNDCGIQCEVAHNLREIRWQKLIWNIPFNPLSVLLDKATTWEILEHPETYHLVESMMDESVQIAKSDGITISDSYTQEMIQKTRKMKPYKTSMLHDYEQGKKIEISAILGKPLKIAEINHVSTPHLRTVYQLLHYITKKHQ